MEPELFKVLQILAALALTALLLLVFIAHVTAIKMPNLTREGKEKFFLSLNSAGKELFPSIHDPPTKELSVIVPSYNEEKRLPLMMDEALEYLEQRQKKDSFTYEVIVVDDGSKDETTEVALKYSKEYGSDKVRVLTLVKNRGKGGAIKMGVLSSRGRYILMADADGATKFADIEKVEAGLKDLQPGPDNMAISCGSRAHLEKETVAQRSYFRTLLMYGFHFLVWFLCVRGIRDTQCGFKLLTREAARQTFSTLHVDRWINCLRTIADEQIFESKLAVLVMDELVFICLAFPVRFFCADRSGNICWPKLVWSNYLLAKCQKQGAFDVELLYIAQCLKIPIAEVAVKWTEIEGSKLVPFWSWLQMGRDLLFIRLRYLTGAWNLEMPKKIN